MKPNPVLINWKLRAGYIAVAISLGALIAHVGQLPMLTVIGLFLCVALLRIALELRNQ